MNLEGPKIDLAPLSKACCLEVFKYLKASKRHSFETPGGDDVFYDEMHMTSTSR